MTLPAFLALLASDLGRSGGADMATTEGDSMTGDLLRYDAGGKGRVALSIVIAILWCLSASRGYSQTFYSTEEGTGLALELMPGVTYFAGPRSGFAIETAPGVTTFDLRGPDLESHRGTLYNLSPTPDGSAWRETPGPTFWERDRPASRAREGWDPWGER